MKNLSVPRTDIFSYTLEKQEWIDHEWLSQVLMWFIFNHFGWLGLNILKALIVSLCFFILFFLAAKGKNEFYSLCFLLLAILAFGYRSFLRPELFSYILLCIFMHILETEKNLWTLMPLQVLWVNLHGYFILGPIAVFLYAIGEFLSGNRLKARMLGFMFIAVLGSCFIGPYFYKGALYPLQIITDVFGKQRLYMQNIHELMMPITSGFKKYVFFWIFAILTSLSFIINLRKAKLKHILIFACAFFASYAALRNMPIFIFIAMPLASINMSESYPIKFSRVTARLVDVCMAFILCAMIYLFLSNRYYVFTNQYGLRKTESNFSTMFMPEGACDFLEKNNIKGRLFNTMDFGPYTGYRFYPEQRIFIDTRTDLYKDNFYELYAKAQNYPEVWLGLQKRYNFNIAFIRHLFSDTQRIIKYLYNNTEWALVYYDKNSVLFLKNIPEYSQVIKDFKIDFDKKELIESDFNINAARFFEKIGKCNLAEKVYIKLLEQEPKFLEAGNNLAAIYINNGRFDDALAIIGGLLKYHPRSPELYANMGTAYIRMGRKDEGLLMLEKSARIDPYHRYSSYMLGIVYMEKGDIDKAINQFVKYLKLDPYNESVHRILGDLYMQKGLLKEAEAEYNEADRLSGK